MPDGGDTIPLNLPQSAERVKRNLEMAVCHCFNCCQQVVVDKYPLEKVLELIIFSFVLYILYSCNIVF